VDASAKLSGYRFATIEPAGDEILKHIGILAHSAEGSALCYLTAVHEGADRLGPHMHPDITMSIIPMGQVMDAWESGDLAPIRAVMAETAARLKAAGADFFVLPDNTAHITLETEGPPLPLPGLHIAEIVADEALARGYRTIGVLGTKFTMDGPVYRGALARRGLGFRIPPPDDRAFINETIFDELCNGRFTDETRSRYVRIIEDLKREGCDAVALVCTEIPILVPPEASPLPTLDSTRLLARAAIDVALGARPMPAWRGGAVQEQMLMSEANSNA
jgi:aspartate racemase